jgi:hypothetical protein
MTKNTLILLVTLFPLLADAAMPYHPWRKVDGTNYNLMPLYAWVNRLDAASEAWRTAPEDKKQAAWRAMHAIETSRPMPAWLMNRGPGFVVREVWQDNLLLVDRGREPVQIVIKNHPAHDTAVDGQSLQFFALRVGNYQWTDALGSTHTVALYDYGIPIEAPKPSAESPAHRPTGPK